MTASAHVPGTDEILSLLPGSAACEPGRGLCVGGVALARLAAEHGTPTYVVDAGQFRATAIALRQGLDRRWPNSEVLFASKAFPAVGVYELAADCELSVDVSGGGEIVMALAAGTQPERMYFHGNAKTDAELALALEVGVGTIIVDNADELDRLQRLIRRPQRVMVRVIPGVAPRTHPSQSTGGSDSKFGLPFDQAQEAIRRIRACELLQLQGVHVHIGSQILDTEPFVAAVESVAQLGAFDCYDLGGGLGVRYTFAERAPSIDEYLDAIVGAARRSLPAEARLLIEPGRSIIAGAGISLYRIVSVKRTGRTFVAVDGGMADNLDPALTGQRYEATIVSKVDRPHRVTCDVVGRQCESGDRLIRDAQLPDPEVGDLLVIAATGAYSYSTVNHYNGAPSPPVVFVENGSSRLVARRETYEDMLRTQLPRRPRAAAAAESDEHPA